MLKRQKANAEQAKRAFAKALINLMESEPFGKITILQICQCADYARQTFYLHFKNKEDVVRYYIADIFDRYLVFLKNSDIKTEDDLLESMCIYWDKHTKYIKGLVKNNLTYIMEDCAGPCIEEIFKDFHLLLGFKETILNEYAFRYLAGGITAILSWWVKQDKNINPDQLAIVIKKMLFTKITFNSLE